MEKEDTLHERFFRSLLSNSTPDENWLDWIWSEIEDALEGDGSPASKKTLPSTGMLKMVAMLEAKFGEDGSTGVEENQVSPKKKKGRGEDEDAERLAEGMVVQRRDDPSPKRGWFGGWGNKAANKESPSKRGDAPDGEEDPSSDSDEHEEMLAPGESAPVPAGRPQLLVELLSRRPASVNDAKANRAQLGLAALVVARNLHGLKKHVSGEVMANLDRQLRAFADSVEAVAVAGTIKNISAASWTKFHQFLELELGREFGAKTIFPWREESLGSSWAAAVDEADNRHQRNASLVAEQVLPPGGGGGGQDTTHQHLLRTRLEGLRDALAVEPSAVSDDDIMLRLQKHVRAVLAQEPPQKSLSQLSANQPPLLVCAPTAPTGDLFFGFSLTKTLQKFVRAVPVNTSEGKKILRLIIKKCLGVEDLNTAVLPAVYSAVVRMLEEEDLDTVSFLQESVLDTMAPCPHPRLLLALFALAFDRCGVSGWEMMDEEKACSTRGDAAAGEEDGVAPKVSEEDVLEGSEDSDSPPTLTIKKTVAAQLYASLFSALVLAIPFHGVDDSTMDFSDNSTTGSDSPFFEPISSTAFRQASCGLLLKMLSNQLFVAWWHFFRHAVTSKNSAADELRNTFARLASASSTADQPATAERDDTDISSPRFISSRFRDFEQFYANHLLNQHLSNQTVAARAEIQNLDAIETKFTLRKSLRQIATHVTRDELETTLVLQFEPCYPIGSTIPDCAPAELLPQWTLVDDFGSSLANNTSKILGVDATKFKKWELSARGQPHQPFVGVMSTWMRNFDSFFHGVRDCMICYSVVHVVSGKIPRKGCPTCKHKFHAECLGQWFKSSAKTVCPLCKQPF